MKFFNTLAGKLETFEPLKEGEVGMYTCGPTVYDYAHIGNFRTFVFEDLLRRFLEFQGYRVKHVMNITDVDDKTIAGAQAQTKSLEEYTAFYTRAFCEDLKGLNILAPNYPEQQPHATREIPGMITLIEDLIGKDVAYERDGSVYYRVAAFPGYGKLSKKKLEMNVDGARVDHDEYEKDEACDFVLWKKAREGEPSWSSPWGEGRPGWHIECSAMSLRYLGETFDIHAGGEDLIFPHHENEIAQSEGSTGKPFVKYWLHSKFLLVNGEKMSKSRGNFFTLRDLEEKGYDPVAIRYELLATHYRTQLNFTLDGLKGAQEFIRKLDECYYKCISLNGREACGDGETDPQALQADLDACRAEIVAALEEDLNISVALAKLLEAVTRINRSVDAVMAGVYDFEGALRFFDAMDRLFGFGIAVERTVPEEIAALLEQRHEIRLNPEFKKDRDLQQASDQLRDEIHARGWRVKDKRPGQWSTVQRARRKWEG